MRTSIAGMFIVPLAPLLFFYPAPVSADPGTDSGPPLQYKAPQRLALLEDDEINESSGLARCVSRPGTYWTHNDSGDRPRLFLFDEAGKTLATFDVAGARATDWEDMCSFRYQQTNYLLIGDVGDNAARRQSVKLYLVEEPSESRLAKPLGGKLAVKQTIEFTYEDGPRDCESIGFDPRGGEIYLVSKEVAMECSVYRLPLFGNDDGQVRVAKRVARIEVPIAVAMDISPDGSGLIVLTYFEAFEFRRRGKESLAAALRRPGRRLTMPVRRQGETICYGHDGRSLFLTSEGVRQSIWKIEPKPAHDTSPKQ